MGGMAYEGQTEFERRVLADLAAVRAVQDDLGDRLERIEGKVDAVSDQLQDVAQAVRELGGDVPDEPPEEATG